MMNVHPEVVGSVAKPRTRSPCPIGFRTPVRLPTTASATGRVGEVRMRRMTGSPPSARDAPSPGATKRCPVRSRMKTLPPRNSRRSAARRLRNATETPPTRAPLARPAASVVGTTIAMIGSR